MATEPTASGRPFQNPRRTVTLHDLLEEVAVNLDSCGLRE